MLRVLNFEVRVIGVDDSSWAARYGTIMVGVECRSVIARIARPQR